MAPKNKVVMNAEVKWGFSESDIDLKELPNDFSEAKKFWEKRDDRCWELMQKYLRCSFSISDIDGDITELFNIDTEEDDDDICQDSIKVYGVDFKGRLGLPIIRASASFTIPTKKKITQSKLDDWQEENDECLDSYVTFYWEIEGVELEDPSLTNNQGLSFTVSDDAEIK